MKLAPNLRTSTATAALVIALSTPAAFAQATVDTELGVETIVFSGDFEPGGAQLLADSGDVTANSANNNVNISLTIADGNTDTVSALAPEQNNLISASATGNTGISTAIFEFDSSTSGDTAAVGTLQSVEADVSASSTNDTHSIGIENTDTGVRTLTGSTLQDNNDITTSATGNSQTSSIEIASGLDVIQENPAQASVAIDASLAAATDSVSSADLLVSSSQEIDDVAGLVVTSTVTGASTTTSVEGLDGASVTIMESDQASSAIGNTATSSIVSEGTTASITGSTALANMQSIDPVDTIVISATTSGSEISATAGLDTLGGTGGDVAASTVSLADNTQSATATGSGSTQTLTLNASSITGEGVLASIADSDTGTGGVQLSALGDAVIGNVQSIEGGVTVSATTDANAISSVVTDSAADANITTSTLSLDGNTQSATATGVSTSNALSLTSGATMSAAGAVASVQRVDGDVGATTTGNSIDNLVINNIENATVDLDDSSMLTTNNSITAQATGASASNSLVTTTGTNNLSVAAAGTGASIGAAGEEQPTVSAGQALTNDQAMGTTGDVTATATGNQIRTSVFGDFSSAIDSVMTTDSNILSAAATANEADNEISLSFNALIGLDAAAGTAAATANEQSLADGATITALNVGDGGIPILTRIGGYDVIDSRVSTSDNTVSVLARGNVTTGNDVIVDATNIASLQEASPVITQSTGVLSAEGTFIAASSQVSGATILASQVDGGVSNTIETQVGEYIGSDATVVSDDNVLSASATANRASNAVELGSATTASIAASGVVANYQSTTGQGSVSAEIGVLGADLGGTPAVLNGAGVIVRVGVDGPGDGLIQDATVSVSGNTAVGEVSGNIAANAVAATATSVEGTSAVSTTSIDISDLDVSGLDAELATASVQDNASALSSDVAATFAIIDDSGAIDSITNSTQTVSDNLQQSFATANRATNSVDLMATNVDDAGVTDTANTGLESIQLSSATVATTSDMDVVANAGGETSSLAMEGNRNQSVANGNIATNTTTLDVTNALDANTVDASITTALTATANNVLASAQDVTADVTASATTDVYNQDVERPGGNEIDGSSVSLGSNATVAQATGNSGTQTLTLGDADTANMGRTGVLANNQFVDTVVVSSTVDQDVSVTLSNTGPVPVTASSLSLDGNSTTALARSNVATNTLNVDGANISSGDVAADAEFDGAAGTLSGAYVLGTTQDNDAAVEATTTQSRVEVVMSNTVGDVISGSTLSLSENASSATAISNTAVNSMSVGANAANVDGTAFMFNNQENDGVVTATGGSAVRVFTTATGGTNPNGVTGSSVMLSDNVSASSAVANQAQNTLTASGTNINSGVSGTSADIDASGILTATAGNLLFSDQSNTAAINSTNTANIVTIQSSTTVDGTGAAAAGSTLSVSGNVTEARGTANLVLNSSISVGGASTSLADATGLIGNFQFNEPTGDVSVAASTDTRIALTGTAATGALSNGSASLQGNSTLALARGNVAENVLSAEGASASAGTSPATADSNGSPSLGSLNASFGVFNEQVQNAAINAEASAIYTIVPISGTGNALNGASASVGGNAVNATGFGNVATNRVTVTSLNGVGNDASAAVFNGQTNAGAITSTVTGANVGIFSFSGGIQSASVGVSGNSIGATSVGNFATSSVIRASR